MHECNLSSEICEYISADDFNLLVSVPGITENDFNFQSVFVSRKPVLEFDDDF